PLFGHVTSDLGESDNLPVLLDPVDDHARPESRPFLARAPASALEPALRPRDVEHFGGKAGLTVLVGVESGEVLAQYLVGLEALAPLGASVPAGYMAVWIEHVDRVVDDRLHEQLEWLLRPGLRHFRKDPLQTYSPWRQGIVSRLTHKPANSMAV